jgi:hypothetical protein
MLVIRQRSGRIKLASRLIKPPKGIQRIQIRKANDRQQPITTTHLYQMSRGYKRLNKLGEYPMKSLMIRLFAKSEHSLDLVD